MKKGIIFAAAILVLVVSCKTAKNTASDKNAYQATTSNSTTPAKVFSVPDNNANKPKPEEAEETKITVKRENISFTDKADEQLNDINTYFVIVGSFSELANAKKQRETLVSEGFTPIILQSKSTGYYRLCVNSFKNEMEARMRVMQIRRDFTSYNDSWLLIKE